MSNPTKTEAIKNFLSARAPSDLAALYNSEMEVQVNIIKGDGIRMEREYQGRSYAYYTDGVESWKSFRIPAFADSDPVFNDHELKFNLVKHAESIGMTGWNFVQRKSIYVAFDFDAVFGHAESHTGGLSSEQLEAIKEKASGLDYVTVRRSTSGSGLHLYVFFETPVSTSNHTEHAALGRAVLAKMSYEIGFDFAEHVDVAGSNMWVWHTKYEKSEGFGLQLLKQGVPLKEVPDWTPHLGARRRKNVDDLIAGQKHHLLDDDHRRIIDELQKQPFETYWDADLHMLKTHTKALETVHGLLKLKGVFMTKTSCSTPMNCYAFPGPKGSFKIYRYGSGTAEADTWSVSSDGNRYCLFNAGINTSVAALVSGGIENAKGAYEFRTSKELKEASQKLGVALEVPENFTGRKSSIQDMEDGRLLVKITKQKGDDIPIGWGEEPKSICKIFKKAPETDVETSDLLELDNTLRYIVNSDGREAGWAYRANALTSWQFPRSVMSIKLGLKERGYKADEADEKLGLVFNNPWMYVNKPFQPEYPGNRQWNDGAAQLAFPVLDKKDNFHCPTWNKILNHVGKSLDEAVKNDLFCQELDIQTGGEYLKYWVAYMFQRPYSRLPYLFFYSTEQGTGKSTFHEALALLFAGKTGAVLADTALKEQYNGQLANAVLCVIEETDMSKSPAIYNKVKEYTTAKHISIRAMYKPQTEIRNATHWVQCANALGYVPIEPGDTRIVVVRVNPIPESELLLPVQMDAKLRSEASDFITEVMALELPTLGCGRLNLPILQTEEKTRAVINKQNSLDDFLTSGCKPAPGNTVPFTTFYEKFIEFIDAEERTMWTRAAVKKKVPQDSYPIGRRSSDNLMCIANIAFSGDKVETKLPVRLDPATGRLKLR